MGSATRTRIDKIVKLSKKLWKFDEQRPQCRTDLELMCFEMAREVVQLRAELDELKEKVGGKV